MNVANISSASTYSSLSFQVKADVSLLNLVLHEVLICQVTLT